MLQLILLQVEAAEAGSQGISYGMIPFIVLALVCLITYLVLFVLKKTGKKTVSKGLFWKLCIGYVLGWIFTVIILLWRWNENKDNLRIKLNSTHWSWSGNTLDDEQDYKDILFISFPIGIILGGGVVLLLNRKKKVNDSSKVIIASDSNAEQLYKLKTLYDSGALTEDEYNIEKAKILKS